MRQFIVTVYEEQNEEDISKALESFGYDDVLVLPFESLDTFEGVGAD